MAQNIPSSGDQQTDVQPPDTGIVLCVHVIPSGLVAAMAEPLHTAQNLLSSGDQQTPDHLPDTGIVLCVHVMPSGLVAAMAES